MSLIYHALRITIRLAIDLYFVEVHATGLGHVPKDGPVLLAANHPNSLIDAVILSMKTARQVSFLGRSGLFSNPLSSRMLDSVGVIPIYRRSDDPGQTGKNADSFRRAHKVLSEGGQSASSRKATTRPSTTSPSYELESPESRSRRRTNSTGHSI